jgi:hypothetical protein
MKTVWIVQVDRRRDYSAAEEYGEIKEIFSSVNRAFDPKAAIEHARRVLMNMEQGDYLVMAGDPALCGICVTVAAEYFGSCEILRWDNQKLNYSAMLLQF